MQTCEPLYHEGTPRCYINDHLLVCRVTRQNGGMFGILRHNARICAAYVERRGDATVDTSRCRATACMTSES
jgi:hypothetical protein